MNPVRVRWRLQRWADEWRRSGDDGANPRGPTRRRVCPECTAVQDVDARVCSRCGAKLAMGHGLLRRLGFVTPRVSVSLGLGVLITLCYARLMRASPNTVWEMLFTMDGRVLWVHGSWRLDDFLAGDYYRIVTSMFLHIGIWHATFNLLALAVVGPDIEAMYGRGPTLFLFLFTGALANLASGLFNPHGNAGASGALMGLIGLAAIRGHLLGTSHGRAVRDSMLSWFVYTMLFGLVVHADNWAHGAGFAVGLLLGAVLSPRWFRTKAGRPLAFALGAIGTLVAALAVLHVMLPGVLG